MKLAVPNLSTVLKLRGPICKRKYGPGSLRKTPTEGTSPIGPGPTCGRLALKPTTQPYMLSFKCITITPWLYTANVDVFLY